MSVLEGVDGDISSCKASVFIRVLSESQMVFVVKEAALNADISVFNEIIILLSRHPMWNQNSSSCNKFEILSSTLISDLLTITLTKFKTAGKTRGKIHLLDLSITGPFECYKYFC
ncbi:hypothetical protein CEXT_333131 [Caerostris extrusa]|uniref:Uncharacterized protein n=1 Tax=Caerostris extrusa TaxID=172846 RepID=A0AAV4Y3P6_CAEEX|nr:hypothetical protein CEXT_333131 [Caerostris extrusa]